MIRAYTLSFFFSLAYFFNNFYYLSLHDLQTRSTIGNALNIHELYRRQTTRNYSRTITPSNKAKLVLEKQTSWLCTYISAITRSNSELLVEYHALQQSQAHPRKKDILTIYIWAMTGSNSELLVDYQALWRSRARPRKTDICTWKPLYNQLLWWTKLQTILFHFFFIIPSLYDISTKSNKLGWLYSWVKSSQNLKKDHL